MASITKNPMVLQAANYVYTWFLNNKDNLNFAKNSNLLDSIESDETVLKVYEKRYANKKDYEDVEGRLKKFEVNNGNI
ncbi:MAG: hypothetical protein ACLT40_00595 [Fusobacterium sp.]|jgi:hypothetical protein